jgi:hypothetical protein
MCDAVAVEVDERSQALVVADLNAVMEKRGAQGMRNDAVVV